MHLALPQQDVSVGAPRLRKQALQEAVFPLPAESSQLVAKCCQVFVRLPLAWHRECEGFHTTLQRTSRQAFVICGVAWRLHQFLASAHVQAVTKPRSTSSAWSSSSPCQLPINRRQGYHQQKLAAMAVPRVWQEVKFSTLGADSRHHTQCARARHLACMMLAILNESTGTFLGNHPRG